MPIIPQMHVSTKKFVVYLVNIFLLQRMSSHCVNNLQNLSFFN